jgi:hypothetical protein
MGRNSRVKSGVSWKIWKIQTNGRVVATWWGPAEIKDRKVVAQRLQTNKRVFHSIEEAKSHEKRRIESKLRKGYERRPRKH